MISIAHGKSMPNILGKGIIDFKPNIKYEVGDVVVFRGNDDKRYCHRIYEIKFIVTENRMWPVITLKADNYQESKWYEKDIHPKQIEGLVIWSFPSFKIRTTCQGRF